MGNTSSAISSAGNIDSYIGELGDVKFDRLLNQSRFLKCVRGKHKDGKVIIKIFIKSEPINLRNAARQREVESEALLSIPNALSYQRALETDRAVYLIRQHIASNLYDRISTRPFFEPIEKRWIVFQLLKGLQVCHDKGIHHGDIKTENVLVTSWNWVYLTDFAFFKPTYLPENNPATFSYYFDTSFRRTCYLAPERFFGPNETKSGQVTHAMDIFSLGCVIAELFLEGSPLFDLAQSFKYKASEYDPMLLLANIEDTEVRSLIAHMISLDPKKRYSAEEYLDRWQGKAFPKYFATFLHEYVVSKTHPKRHHIQSPSTVMDDELDLIHSELGHISFSLGFHDSADTEIRIPKRVLENTFLSVPDHQPVEIEYIKRATGEDGSLILLSILLSDIRHTTKATSRVRACDTIVALSERISDEARLDRVVPFLMSLASDEAPEVRSSAVISLAQVLAMVRYLTPVNAFVFPELILPALSAHTTDTSVLVRISYARCLSLVASTAARYLDLAAALREEGFLTIVGTAVHRGKNIDVGAIKDNAQEADGIGDGEIVASSSDPLEQDILTKLFDKGVEDQKRLIHEHAVAFLTDPDSKVKQTLLQSIADLSIFFGRRQANDLILGHLVTYLNDSDWLLKAAFFDHVVALSVHLGRESVEEYVVSLTIQALTDAEDFIVEKVLIALSGLYEKKLIGRSTAIGLVVLISKFFMHPNLWIQEAATLFVVTLCKDLNLADIYCLICPNLNPYLRIQIMTWSEMSVLQSLRRPLQAEVVEQVFKWALYSISSGKSQFWLAVNDLQEFSGEVSTVRGKSVASPRTALPLPSIRDDSKSLHHLKMFPVKSSEDESRLAKLRGLGMKADDDWKLMILREYFWRAAQSKHKTSRVVKNSHSNKDVVPRSTTVIFDQLSPDDIRTARTKHNPAHDVQSLLRDASMALDHERTKRPLRKHTSHIVSPHGVLKSSTAENRSPIAHSSNSHELRPESRVRVDLNASLLPNDKPSSSKASSINGDMVSPLIKVGSAVSLRGSGPKAVAAVSTTNTVVLGRVDHHCADVSTSDTNDREDLELPSHNYRGMDTTVLQILEKLYRERHHETLGSFVPSVVPVRPVTQTEGRARSAMWEGTLVAHVREHSAAINCVRVSPDHIFFVTASDDGTIRIWDSSRLERNVANRSRITYRGMVGSKIRQLCFLENTYCLAAASDQGSIQIIKVDCTPSTSISTSKFGGMQMIRKHQLLPGEYVTHMEHFVQNQLSVLLSATNLSRIIALDLLTMKTVYELANPPRHGSPTCFCTDKNKTWLLIGTSRGIMDLWDLRFKLRIKSIGLPQSVRISSLKVHPSRGHGRWVTVATAADNEITVWDIENSVCREVYRSASPRTSQPTNYKAWNVDDDKPEQILARFTSEVSLSAADGDGVRPINVRAMTIGSDSTNEEDPDHNCYLIGASTDQKIRVWNMNRIESSTILSGLELGELMPKYEAKDTGMPCIFQELAPGSGDSKANGKQKSSIPRSAALEMQQSHILMNHMDVVLDVAYLQRPYNMVLSVDRSGVLKVFA